MFDRARLFQRILAEAEKDPGAKLVELSRRLQISVHTTERTIRAATGASGRVWLTTMKAKIAHKLLLNPPEYSVKEIAAQVGLGTSGLRKLLLRHYKQTPTRIRQQE